MTVDDENDVDDDLMLFRKRNVFRTYYYYYYYHHHHHHHHHHHLHAGYLYYVPETNHVSRVYSVAAVLYLQFVLHVMFFRP